MERSTANDASTEQPEAQLHLIGPPDGGTWRLSRATREVGRRGVAQARAALSQARRRDDDSHPSAA